MPASPTANQKAKPHRRESPGRRPEAADFVMLTTMYAPPRLHRRTILRERLIEQVTQGVRETPLTLVSAPAGSGKTTLVASWMERPGVPWRVVWLTLSEVTGSPEEFWSFVIEALMRAGVDLPHATAVPGVPPIYDVLVTQLATDLLNREEPVVLVLDEVERLSDPEVPRQLELLLRLAGAGIRLVLLCRVDPLLPVQRYRLTGSMTQVRAADLAFTVDEARALMTSNDVDLTEDALEALHARTDGWAAGLQFAALSLEHLAAAGQDPGAGDWLVGAQDANLAEYLAGEIVNAQPRHLRDFLLRTSVVDPLSAELAEALTGEVGAAMSLVTLVHHNLLMEAVGDLPGCYQAHPLLRELLRAQLAYESPQLVPELHLRAAQWFAETGMVEQAVTHFAAAGSWEQAAELVVDGLLIGDVLRPSASALAQRVADLPPGTPGAPAAVVRAASAVARSELAACDAGLEQVGAGPDDTPRLVLAVAATRLAAASARADHGQVLAWAERGEAALAEIGGDGPSDAGAAPDLRALLLSAKGSAELHRGALPDAAASFAAAAQDCVLAGFGAENAADLGRQALVEALLGRLHHAHELVDTALKRAEEQPGAADAALPAALTRAAAWLHLEAGDLEAARVALTGPNLRPEPIERVTMEALHAVLWSRIERAMGREAHALECLDRVPVVPSWLQDLVAQERVALHLSAGRPADARAAAAGVPGPRSIRALVVAARADLAVGDPRTASHLDPAALERRDDVPVDLQVDAWLLEAQARLAAGSREQAVTAVRRGIRLARPEALRRPFREAPSEVRQVWSADAALAETARWLRDAPPSRRTSPSRAPSHAGKRRLEVAGEGPIIVDALSVRETEVLRHLADLLTTEEVAAAMFVSVNTVKSHIRSILRKLSVSRRNEAIRRARELNVL